jgi:perosamine synthetase
MMHIPMSSPDLGEAEVAAVNRVLMSSSLSIGPELTSFEKEFAGYLGAKQGIGVNSGTSGLHLCTIAADVRDGDMVITTPFSFVASANCVLFEHGVPVFVDVDPLTGNIDPVLVEQAAEDLKHGGSAADRWLPRRLRGQDNSAKGNLQAILPVHVFGQPADMDPILATAQKYNLVVIEDACEAIGAEYKGRKAGTLGDVSTFAFYPNKQMTTGEGGMIVTDDEAWAHLFRSLRNQGRDVFDSWLNHTRLGFNYRLDEMSAALGRAQLARLEELLTKRERVAGWYTERLAETSRVEVPTVVSTTSLMSWFVYVIRIDRSISRTKVMHELSLAGIQSRPYFTPIHLQPFYRETFGYQVGDFPVTEYLGEVSLALPFSSVMTEAEVDYVCEQLRRVILAEKTEMASASTLTSMH